MKVSIWDTYVQRDDGLLMHFDIVVPESITDASVVFKYGVLYLNTKPFGTGVINTTSCQFCHTEQASDKMIDEILQQGFSIIEMENCL